MLRIKERLIAFYTKRLIKRRHAMHSNVGFDQARSIGILYQGHSSQKQAAVQELTTRLKELDKQVTTLCYISDPKEAANFVNPTITLRDISLLGKFTSLEAQTFVDTPFDYLYHVDLEGHPVLDYLLASSKAKCRVGHYTAARAALFEMMVSLAKNPVDGDITGLIAQMLHYTQLLKTK